MVYRDRPVEIVRNVTVEVPWENTTRVIELEGLYNAVNMSLQNCTGELVFMKEDGKNYWPWWVSILCVFVGFGIAMLRVSGLDMDKKDRIPVEVVFWIWVVVVCSGLLLLLKFVI